MPSACRAVGPSFSSAHVPRGRRSTRHNAWGMSLIRGACGFRPEPPRSLQRRIDMWRSTRSVLVLAALTLVACSPVSEPLAGDTVDSVSAGPTATPTGAVSTGVGRRRVDDRGAWTGVTCGGGSHRRVAGQHPVVYLMPADRPIPKARLRIRGCPEGDRRGGSSGNGAVHRTHR